MLVAEENREALKEWITPKLEKISDAEPGVLADYVIALVGAEDTDDVDAVKRNCVDQLSDFLQEHTANFIDEVITAAKTKSFLPITEPSIPTAPKSALSAAAAPFNPPTGPAAQQYQQSAGQLSSPEQSRKRRYNERGTSQPRDSHDPHYNRGPGAERPMKQTARRGGRTGRGGLGAQVPAGPAGGVSLPTMPNFPGLPPMPNGFPQLDPSDPNFPFLAMMMGFPGMGPPGMVPPFMGSGGAAQSKGRKKRCRDYDTKGYCARGGTCPYEHGGEIVLPQSTDEYDPNQASLAVQNMKGANGNNRRGRLHNGANPRGHARASFSQAGPSFDQSNTTIVVEQIPEENFSEEDVRGFFSQFGNILEVDMQAYKRLAIVKYDDYYSARAAYESPKVIFDNRFVKCYWYKADSLPKPPNKANGSSKGETSEQQDEEMIDPEEIAKRQAEAQKAFEERQKKAQEADARFEEIEQKLKENQERMRALQEQLAKKNKKGSTDAGTLIDQLSLLQAEAQGLNADYDTFSYRGRGRGGYRGRGSFPPRARGYAPFRGGYRGRGYTASPFAAGGRTSVKRLDNRPKRIAVSGIESGSKQDEVLREHLLSNYEYESIEASPSSAKTQVITFKERYMAEMFLGKAYTIPDIGKIELAWVPNAPTTTTTKPEAPESDNIHSEGDVKMDEAGAEEHVSGTTAADEDANGNSNGGGDDNYDVADDEDRWMGA